MMIKTATIQEAQNNFSAVLKMIERGSEVVLTDGSQRLAKLTPLSVSDENVSLASAFGSLEPLPEFFWCS